MGDLRASAPALAGAADGAGTCEDRPPTSAVGEGSLGASGLGVGGAAAGSAGTSEEGPRSPSAEEVLGSPPPATGATAAGFTGAPGDELRPGAWAITADLLWDGCEDEARPGLCVIVRGSQIAEVCPVALARARGLPIEEHPGCCLMPGLIDAHVHVELSENHPLSKQPAGEGASGAMAERALRMVRAGITAARDLGGPAYGALWLRDEILAGRLPGPRLLCAGQPITVPGGHVHQWGGVVSSSAGIREVVEQQAGRGADWIKVMATGGMRTPGTDPSRAQFSQDDLQEVVSAASARGLKVAAHAHGTEGVVGAVAAGCHTVEHCTWIGAGWQWGCVDSRAVEVLAEMAGMPPQEALRAATSASARALGLGGECGRLAAGLAADLLVVRGDPTRELRALRRPQLVVARGRRVDLAGGWPPPPPAPPPARGRPAARGGSPRGGERWTGLRGAPVGSTGSTELRRTPLWDSSGLHTGLHRNPWDSPGLHWIPLECPQDCIAPRWSLSDSVDSIGLRWTLVKSIRLHRTPSRSRRLHRTPLDFILLDSSGFRRIPRPLIAIRRGTHAYTQDRAMPHDGRGERIPVICSHCEC
ncbi:unnamed protein product [Prorocentrum cordatum]|uniref:Amidohydrolase-related domain-containing protein n=1 Tax=Prorocentrum cordatum TaxID=2364126 RepID=A0ABN9UEQ4_9DINO|nr:unnamed protein product [Polarella glacialis]